MVRGIRSCLRKVKIVDVDAGAKHGLDAISHDQTIITTMRPSDHRIRVRVALRHTAHRERCDSARGVDKGAGRDWVS